MEEKYSLIGQKIGKLKVIKLEYKQKRKDKKGNYYFYLCECECGNKVIVKKDNLKRNVTKSCGCYKSEISSKNITKINFKHGHSKEKLYNVWISIKERCNNKNNKFYNYYGGRGIKIYNEWQKDYMNFRNWAISNGYIEGLDIDRINNNGDYTPTNCRWITHKENLMNRRTTIKVNIDNKYYTLEQLANEYKINKLSLYTRYRRGKRGNELIKPIKRKNSNRYKITHNSKEK